MWAYIARRLLLMIERSLETAIQWAVFEGNDWLTRAKLAQHGRRHRHQRELQQCRSGTLDGPALEGAR